jgi:hypothetical protein
MTQKDITIQFIVVSKMVKGNKLGLVDETVR